MLQGLDVATPPQKYLDNRIGVLGSGHISNGNIMKRVLFVDSTNRSRCRSSCLGALALGFNIVVTNGAVASTQISGDATGDGVADTVVGEPLSYGLESQTGLVLVIDGITGECVVAIQGEHTGDQFGASIALIHDQDFDGVDELLVGAPGCGKAYLFRSRRFAQSMVRPASSATFVLVAPALHAGSHAIDFGTTVGSFYDMDGDGTAEFRVGYNEVHSQTGQVVPAAIVFEGQIGAPIAFTVLLDDSTNGQADPLDGLRTDTDADGAVTTRDIANVACRLGSSASDVRIDIDHDGEITLVDLFEVIDDAGTTAIGVIDNAPREIGESVFGTWQRAVVRDDGVEAVASAIETAKVAGVIEALAESEYSPLPPSIPAVGCFEMLGGCGGTVVQQALQAVHSNCTGVASGVVVTLVCARPTERMDGGTHVNCSAGTIEVWVDPHLSEEDRCLTLAHELWHVAQACALGFSSGDCVGFYLRWHSPAHMVCKEWFAYFMTREVFTASAFCNHYCAHYLNPYSHCQTSCETIVTDCDSPGVYSPAQPGGAP